MVKVFTQEEWSELLTTNGMLDLDLASVLGTSCNPDDNGMVGYVPKDAVCISDHIVEELYELGGQYAALAELVA